MPSSPQEDLVTRNVLKIAGVLTLIFSILIGLHTGGVFVSVDNWLFDRFAIVQSKFSFSSSKTLVIRTERDLAILELKELAAQCRSKQAGATLIIDDREIVHNSFTSFPGVYVLPLADGKSASVDGINRGAAVNSSISHLLTANLNIPPPPDNYRFDFKVSKKGIPSVNSSRVLAGDLPQDLVQNRIVLIGRDKPIDRRILTPVNRGTGALSPVFFHAMVADSLARRGLIESIPAYLSWSIGAILALCIGLWLMRRNYRGSINFYFGITVVLLLATEAFLFLADLWIMPIGLSVLPMTVIIAGSHLRSVVERDSLSKTLRNLAVETRGRLNKSHRTEGMSPWMMVEQAFSNAFSCDNGFALAHTNEATLVPVSDAGRELAQKRFTPDEMRPTSEPFSTALRNGAAVMGNRLVVIPIRTPARLVGFWIFESRNRRIVEEARRYADKMALYLEKKKKQTHHSAVVTDSARPIHNQLSSAIDSLEDGRKVLAEALDCSREAVLVFDSLGVSEYVSEPSIQLFATAGVDFEKLGPLKLVTNLTEVGEQEICRSLRFVSLHKKEVTLMAREDLIPGRYFMLHLRPLGNRQSDGAESGLPGLVVLIEDVTEIATGLLVKDDFMERFHFQLNNDFEAIVSAASLMIDPRISVDERGELLGIITEKVSEATELFGETRDHLQSRFNPGFVERFPIRFTRIFDAARGSVEGLIQERQLTLSLSVSEYLPMVMGSPKVLENLIHSMLVTLIHNSTEAGTLSVIVSVEAGTLSLFMKNQGFGMPENQLNQLLETGAGGWDTLDRIGSARQAVKAWGGSLDISSRIGQGIEFRLKLATVM